MSSRGAPLFWRIFLTNAAVLVTAGLVLALSPATVSSPVSLGEAAVITGGVSAMLVLNLFLMRRAIAPLARMTTAIETIDPQKRAQRIPVYGDDAEVVRLTEAFNALLDRLERERRESSRLILSAQEEERARIARELHDEVGQGLTAGLLHLERASRDRATSAEEVENAKEVVRESLDEVREITLRLRPEALDDLGLRSALLTLCERMEAGARIKVRADLPSPMPALGAEHELVIYRIAQEAMTNVVRHAGASTAWLTLASADGVVTLGVHDDGQGLAGDASPGAGIEGMRERALLAAGTLRLGRSAHGGMSVGLTLPMTKLQ
jgi:two-component system, NarL family, sensor histidine kinase UhpB